MPAPNKQPPPRPRPPGRGKPAPAPTPEPVPARKPHFPERDDDPDQAEELERQQDA